MILISKSFKTLIVLSSVVCIAISSCKKDISPSPVSLYYNTGKLQINFVHDINGKALQFDTLMYVNAALNQYKITDLEYFVSEVTLHKHNGTKTLFTGTEEIHYVDTRIPTSMTWNLADNIPEGKYDSVTFVFGITAAKNITGLFVNPPENDMAWPDILGGGYHYMKMNGWWKDTKQILESLEFHLGIGQIYKNNDMNPDSITSFVQNYFTVNLPNSGFTLYGDMTNKISITMNIEKWFNGPPYVFNFNKDGYDSTMQVENIMMSHAAMSKIKANGKKSIFTFSQN